MATLAVIALCLLGSAAAQQVGTHEKEEHPKIPFWTCTASGCTKEDKSVTIDANWRWVHNGEYTNCYTGTEWDKSLCPDPATCGKNCHLDGIGADKYKSTYGISSNDRGLELKFVSKSKGGSNVGSRLYMMEDDDTYKVFKLKNREFTMTVDMKTLPCGVNGAV